MGSNEKPKILLVEDNESIFNFEEKWLTLQGYHCLGARDGKKALKLFEEHPDTTLIILDLVLPDISGRVVLKTIRDKNPEVPIIICTAFREKFTELDSSGKTHILFKPFLPTALKEMVEKICD